ncbi:hypothetical protein OPQ81_003614 [Rhizoctonia solani]|nr:hypothetical protein OPQ81_003614 [Rhizoctonia solani]
MQLTGCALPARQPSRTSLRSMSIFEVPKLILSKVPLMFWQTPSNEVRKAEFLESKSEVSTERIQKLYALIIGIDNYPALPSLRGAVADANAICEFLKSELNVPEKHIINLRNEEATRSGIIQGFKTLWKNPDIKQNDPILIYYAGHGGLANANNQWKSRYGAHHIQVIFPFDYQQKISGSIGSLKVNSIPDRTIAALLNKLAAEKGDNVTVIFDSCHSASGTRDLVDESSEKATNEDRRHRSAEVVLDIPHDIDDELFALLGIERSLYAKQQRDAQLLLHTDQTSHIHFAACGSHEKAIEENGRGVFTTELLKKIREARVENITYRNLMKFLKITDSQSPQCYGKNKDRILFDARISSESIAFISVVFKDGAWTLEAGTASGVTQESIWELHETPTESSVAIGRFKVNDLLGSIATLEPLDSGSKLPTNSDDHRLYARCVRIGKGEELVLKVWMSSDDQKFLFSSSHQHIGRIHESGLGYIMTPTQHNADMVLELHYPQSKEEATSAAEPEVLFSWCDNVTKKYGVMKLGDRIPASRDSVETTLFAVARWRWYLKYTTPPSKLSRQEVTMKMLRVANRVGFRSMFLGQPEDMTTNPDGTVEFTVDNRSLYGFKLKSNIRSPLYVRMFYFDTADFSIGDIFGHNTGLGGSPVRFSISSENSVEIGYMKVFWSTEPLELDHLKQQSAFKMKPGDTRGGAVDTSVSNVEWGTVTLPLVLQRRSGA